MKGSHAFSFFLSICLIIFLQQLSLGAEIIMLERDTASTVNSERETSSSNFLACSFSVNPDLPLMNSSAQIEAEIELAAARFSDYFLGTSPPTSADLAMAVNEYNKLGIGVNNGVITGNRIADLSALRFLKTFARYLKFNPADTDIKNKANQVVWWASQEICNGNLDVDTRGYQYRHFGRPAILLKDFLTTQVQDLFEYTLFKTTDDLEHYWAPVYNETYQIENGAINTDQMYTKSSILMAYSLWQDSPEERYRYMQGFKRYMERFFSYTVGTTNGIKNDGSSFHHWTAYNNYMYAFRTAIENLNYLAGTSFQVSEEHYKIFRDAVLVQRLQASDFGLQALSTSGRKPDNRIAQVNQESLRSLAISGGKILNLDTADPVLAGFYNRAYGVDPEFNYHDVAPFEEGFIQLNHASAGLFRNENWVAFAKGFTDGLWGTEIYKKNNRYGRYQSYGALEVLYPGNNVDNGYQHDTWDWNYHPGTTVIRLPWSKLHAERERIDELQEKSFVGSLAFRKKQGEFLRRNYGEFGLFAMDFQEREDLGFGTIHASNNHNGTFTFKKSTFFFDDLIVCLGSGISNNDPTNHTITTLYQRLDNKGHGVLVNGADQTAMGEKNISGSSNNWILSNYGTGFYLFSGNHSLKVKKEAQQNPNQDQIWPVNYSSNPIETYYVGYIDHGVNPVDENYEYILQPNSSASALQQLDAAIKSGNKPYAVYQQDANAHIVAYEAKGIVGYAVFNSLDNLNFDPIKRINRPCLVMSQLDASSGNLRLSLSNPDLGFSSRSFEPVVTKVVEVALEGEWPLITEDPNVQLISSNSSETILQFRTLDGLPLEVLLGTTPVGIQESVSSAFKVDIFPNPTKSIINISSDEPINKVKIYDALGREMQIIDRADGSYIGDRKLLQLRVDTLDSSVYFVTIETRLGVVTKLVLIN